MSAGSAGLFGTAPSSLKRNVRGAGMWIETALCAKGFVSSRATAQARDPGPSTPCPLDRLRSTGSPLSRGRRLRDLALGLPHHVDKAREQIMAVARAGRGLRVVLHRKYRPVGEREAAVRAVEQRHVGLLHVLRQRVLVDREAVVHRGDL